MELEPHLLLCMEVMVGSRGLVSFLSNLQIEVRDKDPGPVKSMGSSVESKSGGLMSSHLVPGIVRMFSLKPHEGPGRDVVVQRCR